MSARVIHIYPPEAVSTFCGKSEVPAGVADHRMATCRPCLKVHETRQRAFVRSLPLVMHDADKLGLHATARLLNEAIRKAGFELAEIIEKAR